MQDLILLNPGKKTPADYAPVSATLSRKQQLIDISDSKVPALAVALAAITVLDQAPGVYFVEHLLWCNPFSCDGTTAIRNPGQSTQAGNCCKATPDTAAVTMIQIMFQWRTNASTAQSAVNSTTRQSSVDHCGSHN